MSEQKRTKGQRTSSTALRHCPLCGGAENFLSIYHMGKIVYACGKCFRYIGPQAYVEEATVYRICTCTFEHVEPIRKRVKGEILEQKECRAVFKIAEYFVVLERTERGYGVQFFNPEKKPLTPLVNFRYLDQVFDRKGAPLRNIIKDRDLFMDLAIYLQYVGAQLNIPKKMQGETVPITEEEVEGPQLEFKGGILEEDLVYEPLGQSLYVWKYGEKKGISKLEPIYRQDERGRTKKTPDRWKITVGGREFYFKKEPFRTVKSFLGALPFRVPEQAFLEKWVKGEIKSKAGKELFDESETYVRIVLDLEERYNAKTLALYLFETWLRNILKVVFNIDISGPFGGGKTTALEAINEVSYHSLLGTASAAAIARMNEKYALAWSLDEYDKQRSWLSDHFIRVGYRWGSKVYRINPKTGREEQFNPFGPKLISYHEYIEDALEQRSLDHIKIAKSLDYHLPIINWAREHLSKPLFHNIFIWYMDNAINLKEKMKKEWPELEEFIKYVAEVVEVAEKMDNTTHILENAHACVHSKNREEIAENSATLATSGNIEDKIKFFRESFYKRIVKNLSFDERSFIESLSDRPCELAFTAVIISRLLGVDVIKDLKEALEVKVLEEQEEEFDVDGVVREVLADMQANGEIPQKDVFAESKKRVKEVYGLDLSTYAFKRVLRDLGFREKKTILRKRKGYRVLVLTDLIRRKLPRRQIVEGEAQPLSVTIMARCEECQKYTLLTHYMLLEGKKYNLCKECAKSK